MPDLEIVDPGNVERALEIFRRDGFVVVRDVLDAEQTQFLAEGCHQVVEEILAVDNDKSGNRGSGRYSFGGSSLKRSQLHQPAWQMMLEVDAMHDLLEAAKLIRHIKGRAVLSKKGRELLQNHGELQAILFETWFTNYNFNSPYNSLIPEFEELVDYRHFFGVVSNRTSKWFTLQEFVGWCLPMDWIDHKRIASAHGGLLG